MKPDRSDNEMCKPAELSQGDRTGVAASDIPDDAKPTADTQPRVPANADYCLIVSEDGEWPMLELFADLASLKARLRELDQQDKMITAFPFYGIPMGFTPGPFRFLYLPDGSIESIFDFSKFGKFIPTPGARPPIDRRFYLGPELMNEHVPADAIVDHRKPARHTKNTPERKRKREDPFAQPSALPEEAEAAQPCMAAVASN